MGGRICIGHFPDYQENGNIEYLTPAQSFHLNVRADKYIRDIKRTDTGVYGPEDIIIWNALIWRHAKDVFIPD